MALIKCNECGKEISDKSKICIHCGCPLTEEKSKEKIEIKKELKYNNTGLIIGGILTTIISIIIFIIGADSSLDIELILYAILGIVCIYLIFLFFTLGKRKKKRNKKKINIFYILSIVSILVTLFCGLVYIMNLSYILEDNNTITIEEETDNRTPREKLIDYLEEYQNATCTNTKCTYTFTAYGLSDTLYYTVDFTNKKYILQDYSSGNSYTEYNYGNDTGYAKDVSTIAWTVTTEVNVTFDNINNEYHYKWTSSMDGMDEVAKIMASQVNNLRNDIIRWCNDLNINQNEI